MKENTQDLAQKIAELIKNHDNAGVSVSLEESIVRINDRLTQIEKSLSSHKSHTSIHNPNIAHPSEQKFDVVEAIADKIIDQYQNEKACTFEPNGKPCDHCSMCSSRGF